VRRALAAIWRGTSGETTLVFAGFSQGVAMAYRAGAFAVPANGLIALAGDVPPDVMAAEVKLPPVLVGRGIADEWYGAERMERDIDYLRGATDVTVSKFDGGHEWTDDFRSAAGEFLKRIS